LIAAWVFSQSNDNLDDEDEEDEGDETPHDTSQGNTSRKGRTGWKTQSSFGKVADSGGSGDRNFDPWDQLRMKSVGADAATMVEERKQFAEQYAARTAFKPTIRSKTHPLIMHCRKIMREQARKREGVMRVEGVKLILTALEYGWQPDAVLCAPLQAADLCRAVPSLRDEVVLAIGTEEVVASALLQPRLDPAIAIGPPPRKQPRRYPERAMLLGVQDPSNLGSLLRTGAALGVTTVYLLPGCPDPFNPIVIRASAGAALLLEYGTEEDAIASRLPVLCADAHDGETVHEGGIVPEDGFILALGHESRGLPEEWLERGTVITLPVHIESLGVAAAGAILLDRLTSRM
jgi:RNA methyltransferase, TrmH family